MPEDFTDHDYVMTELLKSQDADKDNRHAAREAKAFIDKRDGQWESSGRNTSGNGDTNTVSNLDKKPRYTFDLTTPIIKQIAGKLAKADFSGNINPMGGEASKEIAETYDGLVRNIQVISNADNTYNSSALGMITGGLDGWQVVQKFIDSDSFDQDLMIENVENFVDRVWFDVGAEKQDRSDSRFGWKFTGFTPEEYRKKWPNGTAQSLDDGKIENQYFHKADLIMVGEFYYIEEVERELVLLSNNAVFEVNADYEKTKDERAREGVTEVRRRKRKQRIVFMRMMDAGDWLDEEKKTVFEFIPIIPTYGNYKISDNKTLYYGAVERRIDPQRVFNWAMSRAIEEGALSPRAKYWVTTKQAKGHTATLATMNTNSDPVQFYNADGEVPPPTQQGGMEINPGLLTITQAVGPLISETAGLFEANLGANPRAQSGVAIEKLQDKGDVGTIEYFASQEIAICHTLRILVNAIPKVYVGERQVRLLKEDGTFNMVQLNETTVDEQTGKSVTLNNLTIGTYDVTCSAGPSFQNRQQETVSAMVEIGQVNPSIVQIGSDILLNNVTAPGMKILAERERARLFQAGMIPEIQWTDEEKEQIQQAQLQAQQQEQQPTPEEMIGQAELISAKNEEARTQVDVQVQSANIGLKSREQDRKDFETRDKAQKSAISLASDQRSSAFDQLLANQQILMEQNQADQQVIKTMAETLKLIREAQGVDTFTGPNAQRAFIDQAAELHESIEDSSALENINRTCLISNGLVSNGHFTRVIIVELSR